MTLQEDAAQLSKLVRGIISKHRRQTMVATAELNDELLDIDLIVTRIQTAAEALQLGFITRLDFPAVDAKVTRVVPEEDRWMIRRGAYVDDGAWAWDLVNDAWVAVPAGDVDVDAPGFLAVTVCSLASALDVIAALGRALEPKGKGKR